VQRDGAKRADSRHQGKQAAVSRATDLARRAHGQVRIKNSDGSIQNERTYTRDPDPPQD
jgi:hypothetical protein